MNLITWVTGRSNPMKLRGVLSLYLWAPKVLGLPIIGQACFVRKRMHPNSSKILAGSICHYNTVYPKLLQSCVT